MDIVSYMTTKLVDDFASHLRLYRLAQNKLKEQKVNGILTLDFILLKIFFNQVFDSKQTRTRIYYRYFLILKFKWSEIYAEISSVKTMRVVVNIYLKFVIFFNTCYCQSSASKIDPLGYYLE
jgi:hypothetical protein